MKVSTSTADKQVYQDQLYQVSLNFKRTFGEGHDVTGLLLFKRQQYAKGSAFASYREEWAARVTYGFKNRYLFEANGAYNGSEKFGPGNKFGFFPSVAGGWVISNEKFFREHVKFVDFLKVRYSWGIVGSDEVLPNGFIRHSGPKRTTKAFLAIRSDRFRIFRALK